MPRQPSLPNIIYEINAFLYALSPPLRNPPHRRVAHSRRWQCSVFPHSAPPSFSVAHPLCLTSSGHFFPSHLHRASPATDRLRPSPPPPSPAHVSNRRHSTATTPLFTARRPSCSPYAFASSVKTPQQPLAGGIDSLSEIVPEVPHDVLWSIGGVLGGILVHTNILSCVGVIER